MWDPEFGGWKAKLTHQGALPVVQGVSLPVFWQLTATRAVLRCAAPCAVTVL